MPNCEPQAAPWDLSWHQNASCPLAAFCRHSYGCAGGVPPTHKCLRNGLRCSSPLPSTELVSIHYCSAVQTQISPCHCWWRKVSSMSIKPKRRSLYARLNLTLSNPGFTFQTQVSPSEWFLAEYLLPQLHGRCCQRPCAWHTVCQRRRCLPAMSCPGGTHRLVAQGANICADLFGQPARECLSVFCVFQWGSPLTWC